MRILGRWESELGPSAIVVVLGLGIEAIEMISVVWVGEETAADPSGACGPEGIGLLHDWGRVKPPPAEAGLLDRLAGYEGGLAPSPARPEDYPLGCACPAL